MLCRSDGLFEISVVSRSVCLRAAEGALEARCFRAALGIWFAGHRVDLVFVSAIHTVIRPGIAVQSLRVGVRFASTIGQRLAGGSGSSMLRRSGFGTVGIGSQRQLGPGLRNSPMREQAEDGQPTAGAKLKVFVNVRS